MAEKAKKQIKFWQKGLMFVAAGVIAVALAMILSPAANLAEADRWTYATFMVGLSCFLVGAVMLVVGLLFRKL